MMMFSCGICSSVGGGWVVSGWVFSGSIWVSMIACAGIGSGMLVMVSCGHNWGMVSPSAGASGTGAVSIGGVGATSGSGVGATTSVVGGDVVSGVSNATAGEGGRSWV